MSENQFGGETKAPVAEAAPVKIKKLGEGVSTGWENERQFTVPEVMAAISELGIKSADLKVTKQIISYEGVLLVVEMRSPGSASSYSFTLKGDHGTGKGGKNTFIERIDFTGPDSEDFDFGEIIAEYKNNAWVKQ